MKKSKLAKRISRLKERFLETQRYNVTGANLMKLREQLVELANRVTDLEQRNKT